MWSQGYPFDNAPNKNIPAKAAKVAHADLGLPHDLVKK